MDYMIMKITGNVVIMKTMDNGNNIKGEFRDMRPALEKYYQSNNPLRFLLLFSVLLIIFCGLCSADQKNAEPNKVEEKHSVEPMIIWYQVATKDPAILRRVLSSGIFTHVMLGGMHAFDLPDYSSDKNFREQILACKEAGVKIIWRRWLWPGYNFRGFTIDSIYDPKYYIAQIQAIKKESGLIGADYTAFDAEPYGKTPVKKLRKRNLTQAEYDLLEKAILEATEQAGKVDFVLPAHYPYPRHTSFTRDLYRPFDKFGKLTIAEHTYFDNASRLHCKDNEYDIFGAYCMIKALRPGSPTAPYFTPRGILQRRDLWGNKKGLFIYTFPETETWKIALEFSKIKNPYP